MDKASWRCETTASRLSLEPDTLVGVGRWMLRHPWRAIGCRWNYKAALLSAAARATLFFGTNVSAGLAAATAALTTEFLFRFVASGFFGAVTQAFRRAKPERAAMLTVIVLLPVISHSLGHREPQRIHPGASESRCVAIVNYR